MKRFFEGFKNLICLICVLGEIILLIPIVEIVFKNQDLGMLIICFIACELILRMFGFNSLVKTCLSLLEKK